MGILKKIGQGTLAVISTVATYGGTKTALNKASKYLPLPSVVKEGISIGCAIAAPIATIAATSDCSKKEVAEPKEPEEKK